MSEICKLLNRLVKIYQIPNIDNEAIIYLSEWIMEEYQHNEFGLILEALKSPTKNLNNTWRLTPDTISYWIDSAREKRFDREAAEDSKRRQEEDHVTHEFSPETEKLIRDYINNLLSGISKVPVMTPDEIKANGQLRPKAYKVPSTDSGYVKDWVTRIRSHQEKTYRERHPNCTDQEVNKFLDSI